MAVLGMEPWPSRMYGKYSIMKTHSRLATWNFNTDVYSFWIFLFVIVVDFCIFVWGPHGMEAMLTVQDKLHIFLILPLII